MSRHSLGRRSIATAALGILLLAGCAETAPTRFYTLSKVDAPGSAAASVAADRLAVAVGPVSLPQYLDRPQMVRRSGANTFDLAGFDSWGEPLQDMFSRIVAENLSALLATDRVFVIPRRRSPTVDYQVEIEVLRFDTEVGGDAVLTARWEIFDGDGKQLLLEKSTVREPVAEPVEGGDYEPVAAAMSRTVSAFSEQLARAIQVLSAGR
jgi:uncharacterized lipoprotein YmbA